MKSFEENPFAHVEQLMRLEFSLEGEAKMVVPVAIEELAYAQRWDDSGEALLVYLDAADVDEIRAQVARLVAAGYAVREVSATRVEPEDWVAQSQASFAPIHAGDFFVYCDSYEGDIPEGLHSIKMNAGAAFGTGEHATTSGCLAHMSELCKQGARPKSVLDIGCGTAILAIGAKKFWPDAAAVAVDLDPPAIEASTRNCEMNHVAAELAQGDGYMAAVISKRAP